MSTGSNTRRAAATRRKHAKPESVYNSVAPPFFVKLDEDALRTSSDRAAINTYEADYKRYIEGTGASAPVPSAAEKQHDSSSDDDDDRDHGDEVAVVAGHKRRVKGDSDGTSVPSESLPAGLLSSRKAHRKRARLARAMTQTALFKQHRAQLENQNVTPRTAETCSKMMHELISALIQRFGFDQVPRTSESLLEMIRDSRGRIDFERVPYPPQLTHLLGQWIVHQPSHSVLGQAARDVTPPLVQTAVKLLPLLTPVTRAQNAQMLFAPPPGMRWPSCVHNTSCEAYRVAQENRKPGFALRAFYLEHELQATRGDLSKLPPDRMCLMCLRVQAHIQKNRIENNNYAITDDFTIVNFYNLTDMHGEYLMSDCFGPTSEQYAGMVQWVVTHQIHKYQYTCAEGVHGFVEKGYGYPETHEETLYFRHETC